MPNLVFSAETWVVNPAREKVSKHVEHAAPPVSASRRGANQQSGERMAEIKGISEKRTASIEEAMRVFKKADAAYDAAYAAVESEFEQAILESLGVKLGGTIRIRWNGRVIEATLVNVTIDSFSMTSEYPVAFYSVGVNIPYKNPAKGAYFRQVHSDRIAPVQSSSR